MCRPRGVLRRRLLTPVPTPQPVSQPAPIPIKSVSVSAKIVDFVTEVVLSQTFENTESNPIEAVYEFPLLNNCSICGFSAKIDGKLIQGQVQEKEEAKDTYDDGIAMGHGAYLLDESEEDPNVFSVSVGNLPPNKEVQIDITYVQELEFADDGELKWTLPSRSEVDPYDPYRDTKKFKVPKLNFALSLDMNSFIKKVSSPSHPISFEFGDEPTQATIELASEPEDVHKDLEVSVRLAKPHTPGSRVQKDKDGNVGAMVSLYPKLDLDDDEEIYTEMVFIVDRSGSMAGSRINQVKQTLQIFLRSLGEGTMFNIIGFGSRTDMLFKSGSVEYNETNLETAVKHVDKMRANLGGTNILKPLKQVLESTPIEGYPRQLFVLTDGEVSNTKDCIDYVRKHADTTRVFTFGVGNDASVSLVKGMAKAGEGFFELVKSGESMEGKVLRQLNRAMQPALTDIKLDWSGIEVSQAPYRLPPLFCGGRLVVYGFLPKGMRGKVSVTLSAMSAVKPYSTSMEIDVDGAEEGDIVHRLGARALIASLKEGRSYMHDKNRSFISPYSQEKADEETIRLSTTYSVISHLTSFVAVEERDEATEGTMEQRKVPVSIEKARTNAPPPPASSVFGTSPAYPPTTSVGAVIGGGFNPFSPSYSPTSPSYSPTSPSYSPTSPAYGVPSYAAAPPAPLATHVGFDAYAGGGGGPPTMTPTNGATPPGSFGSIGTTAYAAPRQSSFAKGGKSSSRSRGRGGLASGLLGRDKRKKKKGDMGGKDHRSISSSISTAHDYAPARRAEEAAKMAYASPAMFHTLAASEDESEDEECMRSTNRDLALQEEQRKMAVERERKRKQLVKEKKAKNKEEEAKDVSDDLRQLILKQNVNGSWAIDALSVLRLDTSKIRDAMPAGGAAGDDATNLWATAVALAYLEAMFSSQRSNWALVARKARRYVKKQAKAIGLDDVDWLGQAKKAVSAAKQ